MHTKSDLSGNASERSAAARARFSGEVHGLLEEVEGLVKETASLGADELARAKDRIGARLAAAKQSAQEISGALTERARRGAEVTNNYVHQKPWTAIGAGAAVAFLLGFVMARR